MTLITLFLVSVLFNHTFHSVQPSDSPDRNDALNFVITLVIHPEEIQTDDEPFTKGYVKHFGLSQTFSDVYKERVQDAVNKQFVGKSSILLDWSSTKNGITSFEIEKDCKYQVQTNGENLQQDWNSNSNSLQKPESKRNQGSTCRDAETRVELIPSCNETQLNSVKVLTLFKSDCDACNHQSLLVHQVFGPKEGIINSALVHNRRAQKDYVKAIESTFNVLQWDFAIIKDYLTNTEEQNLQKSVETRIFNFNETYISLSKNLQEEISKIKQLKSHSYDQIADAIASETISGNENTSEQFTCYLQDKYKLLKEDEVYSSFNKLLECLDNYLQNQTNSSISIIEFCVESYSYRNTRLNTISNKLTYTFKVITVFEWTKEEFSEIAGKNHIESYKKVVAQVESGQGHSNIPLQKSIYWIGKKQGLLGSKLGYVTTGWVLSKETFKDFFDKFKTSHENRLDARILQNNDTNFNRLNMFLKKLRRLKNAMSCFSHRKNK